MDPNKATVKDIADVFDLTERMVRNWLLDEHFPKPNGDTNGHFRNLYSLKAVIDWHENKAIEKLKSKIDATPENLQQAQLFKVTQEGRLKELDVATREGELVEAEEVARTWSQALGRFRDTLLRSGASFTQDVLALPVKDATSIQDAYTKNASSALEELSTPSVEEAE